MMDFIKKSKWASSRKLSVIFGVMALFTGLIMPGSTAMGQTEIATASVTPTLIFPHYKLEKSPVPKPKPDTEPTTPRESNEYDMREITEQSAKGQLDVYTPPNSESEIEHPLPRLSNFKVTPLDGAALLTWDAVPGAKNYRVHISMDGKKWKPVFIPFKGTSVTVGNLENGKMYYFEVAPARVLEGTRVIQTVVPTQSAKNVR
jgi:hypothetical protein